MSTKPTPSEVFAAVGECLKQWYERHGESGSTKPADEALHEIIQSSKYSLSARSELEALERACQAAADPRILDEPLQG